MASSSSLTYIGCVYILLTRWMGAALGGQIMFRDDNLYEGSTCITSNNGRGICLDIRHCAEYQNIIPHSSKTNGICGFKWFIPLVCCSDEIEQLKSRKNIDGIIKIIPNITRSTAQRPLPYGQDPGPSDNIDAALGGCGTNTITRTYAKYRSTNSNALRFGGVATIEDLLKDDLASKVNELSTKPVTTGVISIAKRVNAKIQILSLDVPLVELMDNDLTAARLMPSVNDDLHVDFPLDEEDTRLLNSVIISIRLIGAVSAFPAQWPWMVMIGTGTPRPPGGGTEGDTDDTEFFCDGVIIDTLHVLTASHCLNREPTIVRLGVHDTKSFEEFNAFFDLDPPEYPFDLLIEEVIPHPDYKWPQFYNDVAIIRLQERIKLQNTKGRYPISVCLPGPEVSIKQFNNVTMSGWGSTIFGGRRSRVLRTLTDLPMVNKTFCEASYNNLNSCPSAFCRLPSGIVDGMFCAGDTIRGGRSACQGDSGGPAVVMNPDTGRWTIVGIVNGGYGCGKKDYPGILADVEYYLPWIKQVTNNGFIEIPRK